MNLNSSGNSTVRDNYRGVGGAMVSRTHPLAHRRRQSRISAEIDLSIGPSPTYQATQPLSSFDVVNEDHRFLARRVDPGSSNGSITAPPEYSPPTSRPRSPLEIPELIRLIGERIPLWVLDPYANVFRFYPKTLVRCSSVSRLWHQVMTPLVWYLIDDSQPYKIPIEVLRRNAQWIRILERHHRFLDLNSILVDDDACSQPCSPLSKEQRPQSVGAREIRSPSTSTYLIQSPPSRIYTAPRWRLPWRRSQQRPLETTTHQEEQRPSVYISEKEPLAKQTTFSKSEVAQPRTSTRTSSGMVLLKQLTFSAWIPGVDKVLRMNPNLERLTWQGASLNKDVPVGIWDALLGDIPLSSSLLPEVPSPFQKLRDIHFKRCNLDATLLLPVLEKLPGLRILRFTDVVLLNMNSVRPSNTSTNLAVGGVSTDNPQPRRMIPSYRLHQIREIRLGIGLQKSGGLEAIVRYCPYLMRLILESDFDAWSGGGMLFHHHLQTLDLAMLTHRLSPPAPAALAPKQDTFLVLVQHLKQSCLRLRAIEYVAPQTRSEGVPLLSDEQVCMFAQCLETGAAMALPKQFVIGSYQSLLHDAAETRTEPRGIHSEQESIRAADEQDEKDLAIFQAANSSGRVKIEDLPSYFKVEFKADLCRLDHLTAWALCQASMTLQSVSLFLFHGTISGEEENIRHSLRNALQILTTCQGLRSFELEFDYQNSTSQPIALATYCRDIPNPLHLTPAAWILFDAPWNCPGLETLVLSGIKRSIYLDREKITPDLVYAFHKHGPGSQLFVPVKMRELMAIAGLKDKELGIDQRIDTDSDELLQTGDPDLPAGGLTQGLRQFQQIMFTQLARLSELKELSLNGSSFREFSRVQRIVSSTSH